MNRKAIIVSAPSGAGKSTLVHRLMETLPQLAFSVSACTRAARPNETHGRDYYFLLPGLFKKHIEAGDFIEWEEVYPDHFYGTLKSEIDRIWSSGKIPVFDVDVMGGLNLKQYFGKSALSIFIQPPSMEVLRERLENRNTESAESLEKRIGKAGKELSYAPKFDILIVNDNLDRAIGQLSSIVTAFIL